MKHILVLPLLACLFFAGCKVTTTGPSNPEVIMEVTPTALPYTITLSNPVQLQDSLQSFCFAEYQGYWFMVGGRTNGFHGTGGSGRTFPVKHANKQFIVYQPSTQKRWAAPLPAEFAEQLSSTNMPFVQDGGTLWITGGYGCSDQSSRAPCYETYDRLLAIDLQKMIGAITARSTGNLDQYISSIQGPRFQVTGGVMAKIGDYLYLVMGQNYDTIYVNGITGQYTEEIRRFKAQATPPTISITDYSAVQNAQFHRRDLNVLEAVRPNGNIGLNVLAGVFQPNAALGAPWPHPVLIDQDPSSQQMTYQVDTKFSQVWNAYDCGNVLFFDTGTRTMYTSLLGGITSKTFGPDGKIDPAAGFLPWSKYASTVAQYPNGETKEYPQFSPSLPGFVGASGEVILNPSMPLIPGSKSVIDYARLPSGDNLVGWLYGGIISTGTQTNAVSLPSFSSSTVYEVHINKQ